MQRKFVISLLAAGAAMSGVSLFAPVRSVAADGTALTVADIDSDKDFLPDAVEWVVLTDSTLADSDGDDIPDFVEVVEAGHPREGSVPLPADQQMRLVITGPQVGSPDQRTWMHVFLRVLTSSPAPGAGANAIQSFDTWLERPEWPGLRFPLNGFGAGGIVYRERVTQEHGVWLQFSFPLVSPQILAFVLPCTIYAESTVAGKSLVSGMKLISIPDGVATLVPFAESRFAIQSLSPVPLPTGGSIESNRVCILDLEEISSGLAGVTYEVVGAGCEDANALECSTVDCGDCVGWEITIPGGTELIGGQ